ncbi:MAG: hypothetical protein KatS3mg001_155 [Candidatus Pacearchaeota archaeon]|nr:MAG: hypothetical protein KatS3mg001_155 [Candidatus Pacearchaeota archaeon]
MLKLVKPTKEKESKLETCALCGSFTYIKNLGYKYYISGLGHFHKECYEYIIGIRNEKPKIVTVYEPTLFDIFKKRGFRAFLRELIFKYSL